MHKKWEVHTAMILGLLIAIMMCMTSNQQADARPKYFKSFMKKYPKIKHLSKKEGCLLCHPQKKKKFRNNYGDAIKPELPKKKTTDVKAIDKALKSAEDKPSAVPGKTFGDLIKQGKLPNSTK